MVNIYRGERDNILEKIFNDYPDVRVVVGSSYATGSRPWLQVPSPVGLVYISDHTRPCGVVVNDKQYDNLEIRWSVRYNARLTYHCNVYDVSCRSQTIEYP